MELASGLGRLHRASYLMWKVLLMLQASVRPAVALFILIKPPPAIIIFNYPFRLLGLINGTWGLDPTSMISLSIIQISAQIRSMCSKAREMLGSGRTRPVPPTY